MQKIGLYCSLTRPWENNHEMQKNLNHKIIDPKTIFWFGQFLLMSIDTHKIRDATYSPVPMLQFTFSKTKPSYLGITARNSWWGVWTVCKRLSLNGISDLTQKWIRFQTYKLVHNCCYITSRNGFCLCKHLRSNSKPNLILYQRAKQFNASQTFLAYVREHHPGWQLWYLLL